MGWQNLSASLRRWDSQGSRAVAEVEAAAEELLASGDDAETLQLFSEALDPSLQRGTDFLQRLAKTEGAKCRCDAVWYGDTIAYGCKTCGLSSASCICVFCFDAGDHEGHEFYISRSDYGCCDCGDAYAWRKSGFCRHHPGPRGEVDPAQLLPEATRRRAQLLIPAQVRRLAQFHPSVLPGVPPPPSGSHVPRLRRRGRVVRHMGAGDSGGDAEASGDAMVSDAEGQVGESADAMQPVAMRALVSGINLRVTEEQLKEFLLNKVTSAGTSRETAASAFSLELVRDQDTKASKGRAHVNVTGQACLDAIVSASGEVLRGSPLRVHVGAEAIAEAEKHLQALETNLEWLLSLGGFHDGLRKIIGQVFLDNKVLGQGHQCAVEVLLRHSHLMEPSVRKLETNLMVDLMLDLDFKLYFAQVFTRLYRELVLNREGNQDTNELGDFTCQIFTRQDVTLELVQERDLIRNLLDCLWDLLRPALVQNSDPAVFNHESNIFRDHEIIQCSMDLLYVLDHAEIAREIIHSPRLRGELWNGWIRILISMQAMNQHERRSGTHVEFTNPAWGNALTLHTDLMSNTWLILDAVESKAKVEAVVDMASLAWSELRAWMLRVHVAEERVGAATEGPLHYEVSSRSASFHLPVNRVLAMLIHQLCLRSPVGDVSGSRIAKGNLVWEAFKSAGMKAESDILWWMEHPLRALVLHGQVSAGMWRRNGEALENESEFYRMNYWHHLLIDMDLLVLRLAALVLRPVTFFQTVVRRFELWSWLNPGDPLLRLLGSAQQQPEEEFGLQKLQSFVLLLYQLLSPNSSLALDFGQLVRHTTRQYLSVGPKSHSQLWDPRLERSTATSTAKDQQMLESALREISSFSEADGSGHSSAKYHLKNDQWPAVDPYFHLFSWSEQQKVEENLATALKDRREGMLSWVEESARLQPEPLDVFRDSFQAFCTCGLVQALCWILLVRLAFQGDGKADGRLLVLALFLALRCASTEASEEAVASSQRPTETAELPDSEVLLFTLAEAMGPDLCTTARMKFRIAAVPTDVSLLDAVERLAEAPADSVPGGLARGLRSRLLRSWRQPAVQASAALDSGSGSVDSREPSGVQNQDEAHRAKRRKAAQERQQRMLNDLKKRQAAFMTGAQGQQMLEEASSKSPAAATTGDSVEARAEAMQQEDSVDAKERKVTSEAAECVVCISQQEGEDADNPLGFLCFLRPAAASTLPRQRVPTEQAVLLQQPRATVGGSSSSRSRPQCFEPKAKDGLVLARACSHRMHYSCWRSFRPTALASGGGRLSCPYCGSVVNALLPDSSRTPRRRASALSLQGTAEQPPPAPGDEPSHGDVEAPFPQRHAQASSDFLSSLEGQLRRLGDEHLLPPQLVEAVGLGAVMPHPLPYLAKLCADNITLTEVRARTRASVTATVTGSTSSSSSSAAPPPQAKRPGDGAVVATSAASAAVLRSIVEEALEATPSHVSVATEALATSEDGVGKLGSSLLSATPHGRFQILAMLLLSLCANPPVSANASAAARKLVHGFYLLEAVVVLAALADRQLIESELHRNSLEAGAASSIWSWVWTLAIPTGILGSEPGRITPLRTREEAADVLRLALNSFIFKVKYLLSLLCVEDAESVLPMDIDLCSSGATEVLLPAEEHSRLASAALGLHRVDDLLMLQPAAIPVDTAALTQLLGSVATSTGLLHRGLQPPSPLLLVFVSDAEELPDQVLPSHVWQVSTAGFERVHAAGNQEFMELSPAVLPSGCNGRLFCVAYRMTLPVITGKIYQKFYTQFVHARCTVCKTSSPIPTLCLLCGTFLCCNAECCRRESEGGQTIGEVTHHAQACGFGTCIFLQLSNSLVHIVSDGFIACWGSLYLDGHGEEEYNLSRPLHISEVRLNQLTQSIREVSIDFESRLKWKKVVFV